MKIEITDYKTNNVIYKIEKEKVKSVGDCLLKIKDNFYKIMYYKDNKIFVKEFKKPLKEKELFQEEEITCPFCGYAFEDSWEFDNDEGEIFCEICGAEFGYSRIIEVSYNMEIKKDGNICNLD